MKTVGLILSLCLACSLTPTISAQRRKIQRAPRDIRISKDKPTVYISFVRFGKLEPLHSGESGERVWLRLHNNTRWMLWLEAGGASEGYGDASLFYEVEKLPKPRMVMFESSSPLPVLSPTQPQENTSLTAPVVEDQEECEAFSERCHSCSIINLPPGRSILFSVPREHLCKDVRLYVSYSYGWEGKDARDFFGDYEPQHNAVFFGSRLPKRAK